jgi:two-component system response regulator GlrR
MANDRIMLPVRCAVVAPNPAAFIVPTVLSTLDRIKDVVVEPPIAFSNAPGRWSGVDGVVVVSDRRNLAPGLEQIGRILSDNPCCSVVAVGDALDESDMLSLLAAGAFDFVAAPFASGELQARIRRALGLTPPAGPRRHAPGGDLRLRDLIGTSRTFLKQTAKLPILASRDVGVLLLGETGTGKEVFAQAIHYLSARASKPWVTVNCGAIPTDLIESELFGHVRGAYTTAHAGRKGLVSEAEGGTLLLDEIDCLSYGAQAKLLRFLQEKEFRPVGSNAVSHADVRIIATSNSRLGDLAAKGTFRSDLYFRLNVLSVTLPALRERQEDVPLLAQHFIERSSRAFERHVTGLTPPALRRLMSYDWPGNVRELKHVIERAVLMSNGPTLGVDDLDLAPASAEPAVNESFHSAKARVVESFERTYLEQLLATCSGNVSHAARMARKNRRAFWELLRKHRIDPQPFR